MGGASAKAGQFGKQEIFGFGTSSPYVGEKVVSSGRAGSQFNDDVKSTYGFAPTGDILAKGYASDVGRETKAFDKSVKLLSSLQGDKKADAAKAYKKVFTEMEALDLACKKKEQAHATKENSDLLEAIAAYKAVIS